MADTNTKNSTSKLSYGVRDSSPLRVSPHLGCREGGFVLVSAEPGCKLWTLVGYSLVSNQF